MASKIVDLPGTAHPQVLLYESSMLWICHVLYTNQVHRSNKDCSDYPYNPYEHFVDMVITFGTEVDEMIKKSQVPPAGDPEHFVLHYLSDCTHCFDNYI